MAAINVGVQYIATVAGIAAPITIPVMLVVGVTLRRLIDPMFGDGQYAQVLAGMRYHRSLEDGWKHFGELSVALYDTELAMLQEMKVRAVRGTALNAISAAQDQELEKAR